MRAVKVAERKVKRECEHVVLEMARLKIETLVPIQFYGSQHEEGVDVYFHPLVAEHICLEVAKAFAICNDVLQSHGLRPLGLSVEGHTSATPHGEQESLRISTRRALRCRGSIERHLRSLARPHQERALRELISHCGWGCSRPLRAWDDGGNYELNRRVEMVLVPPTDSPFTISSDGNDAPADADVEARAPAPLSHWGTTPVPLPAPADDEALEARLEGGAGDGVEELMRRMMATGAAPRRGRTAVCSRVGTHPRVAPKPSPVYNPNPPTNSGPITTPRAERPLNHESTQLLATAARRASMLRSSLVVPEGGTAHVDLHLHSSQGMPSDSRSCSASIDNTWNALPTIYRPTRPVNRPRTETSAVWPVRRSSAGFLSPWASYQP